jgi:hypothetical protein
MATFIMQSLASSPSGSAQWSVWSVLYFHARTPEAAAVGSEFTKVMAVGVPRAATITGPMYVSFTPTGHALVE